MSYIGQDFEHLFIEVRDSVSSDITSCCRRFIDFQQGIAARHDGSKVFVHCEAGVSRSPSIVIALLMTSERRRFYETFLALRKKRGHVLPNIGFASQLQRFEDELFGRASRSKPSSLCSYLRHVCNLPAELDVIDDALERHDDDAVSAIREIFGGEIPRVVQGVRR
jgi:hypothetical protein